MKTPLSNKGFTLIEILVVISILSLLYLLLLPKVNGFFLKSQETGIRSDFRIFQQSSEMYLRESVGRNLQIDGINRYLDNSNKLNDNGSVIQSKKKDPWNTFYEVKLEDQKITFVSFGKEEDTSAPVYTLVSYYYKGMVDSCTTGFQTGNIELDGLKDLSETFVCGEDLPVIPDPPAPPVIPPALPNAPANFVATNITETSIDLSWNQVIESTGYVLKRNGTLIYSGNNRSFSDTGLSEDTSYTYTLQSLNTSGESLPATLTVSTTATIPEIPVDTVQLPTEKNAGCYVIRTAGQLQSMKLDNDGCFELGNDINASSTLTWNGGLGFEPVVFTGELDGKNYTINNLVINRPGNDNIGLFDLLSGEAVVSNLTIENGEITGDSITGMLVGYAERDAYITNVKVSGDVTGIGTHIGGIVGYSDAPLDYLTTETETTVKGDRYVGGIAGYIDEGSLENSISYANVSGRREIGGVIGENYGVVSNITSTGVVSGTEEQIGGILGYNDGSVSSVTSTSSLVVSGDKLVGGIIGNAGSSSSLTSSTTSATVSGRKQIGGAIGLNYGTVDQLVSSATVSGTVNNIGGIIGDNLGSVSKVLAEVGTSVTGDHYIGGLLGFHGGSIENGRSLATVNGANSIGGAIGYNNGTVFRISANAHVNITPLMEFDATAGGLIGYSSYGTIRESYSSGDVTVTPETYSFSPLQCQGGFAGSIRDTVVENSYSTGEVSGIDYAASFSGCFEGDSIIINSYATGKVSTIGAGESSGFTNYKSSSDTAASSYFDTQTTQQTTSTSGNGRTTLQMKTESTYIGWDFTNIWIIHPSVNNGYPALKNVTQP